MRKKEEVCGKPTQYNLQTLQYNWRELPDTHFEFQQENQQRRGGTRLNAPYATDYVAPPIPINKAGDSLRHAKTDGDGYGNLGAGGSNGFNTGAEELPMVDYTPFMRWSHEDIRQMLRVNSTEANRSYMSNGLPVY